MGSIFLTIFVISIGIFMFWQAGKPMTDDARVAQEWLTALCENDLDTLYKLSYIPDEMSREQFAERLKNHEISPPCEPNLNLNLVQNFPVPLEMPAKEIRFYQEASITDTSGNVHTFPLWVYRTDQWRVKADFLGATLETPIPQGNFATLIDNHGINTGYTKISEYAKVYQHENGYLIAVHISLQTLSRAWDEYQANLFMGTYMATPILYADQVPDSENFLPATGGYTSQNILMEGVIWFQVSEMIEPAILGFTAKATNTGTAPAAYLAVNLSDVQQEKNPFVEISFIEIADGNPIFEILLENSEEKSITINCNEIILKTMDDRWLRATDCTFAPDIFQQVLYPDERIRARITFAGYNLSETDLAEVVHHRVILWQKSR